MAPCRLSEVTRSAHPVARRRARAVCLTPPVSAPTARPRDRPATHRQPRVERRGITNVANDLNRGGP